MNKPFLQFNFQQTVRQFTNPIKVWNTTNIKEIPTIFEELEQFLDKGYYIAGFVSYEAAPAFDPSYHVHQDNELPLIWFAAYEKPFDKTDRLEDMDSYDQL